MAGKRREVRKTAASDFLKAAWGHRNAAEILEAHTGIATSKPNATFFAFYNVLGLALELYLKSFLRTTGLDAYTIGQTYGHKLDELLRDSLASGLLNIPAPTRIPFSSFNLQKLIDTINPYYSSHLYRYLDEDFKEYKYIISTNILWSTMDYLQGLVETAILLEAWGISIEKIDAQVGDQIRKWRAEQNIDSDPLVVKDNFSVE
jgi:hypothetical protein